MDAYHGLDSILNTISRLVKISCLKGAHSRMWDIDLTNLYRHWMGYAGALEIVALGIEYSKFCAILYLSALNLRLLGREALAG